MAAPCTGPINLIWNYCAATHETIKRFVVALPQLHETVGQISAVATVKIKCRDVGMRRYYSHFDSSITFSAALATGIVL